MGNCFGKPDDDNNMIHSKQTTTTTTHTSPAERNNIEKERVSDGEKSRGKIVTPNLKMFTLDELKSATRNFRPDTVVGEGGFGRVFKGWIDPNTFKPSRVGVGIPVAVKKSNPDSLQGLQEWQVRGPEPLSWDIRLKIAIGAARGLAFLHTSEKSVIYRDFKSSNILLDQNFNAKLSDFGLAKLGPVNGRSHITTRVMGTYGYAAPEYMATGHLYVKSDVYGFGVVLLELLTGLAALDTNRPTVEQNLVEYTKPCLSDKKKLKRIMDPRMDEQYSIIAALQIAHLILKCLESDPKNRPSMEEVLGILEKAQNIKYKPKVKKASAVHQRKRSPEEHPTQNQLRTPIHHNNNGYSKSRTHSPQ
ncbi:Serine/threonine-protein kinase, active site [Sesbania bispinosa]|nr:Serine/threonine-protein kinase, active site [Sesbania bispinosa]